MCCFVPAGREARLGDKVFGIDPGICVASRGHHAGRLTQDTGAGRVGLVLQAGLSGGHVPWVRLSGLKKCSGYTSVEVAWEST